MVKMLKKILPFLAMFEGVEHIVFSSISFWGIFTEHVTDWRIWFNPSADFLFGFIGILTGIVFRQKGRKRQKRAVKNG